MPGFASNKENILNNLARRDNSKEEEREPKGVISNIVSNKEIVPREVVVTSDDEIDSAKFQSSTIGLPIIITTTTAPVICMELVSNENIILNIPMIHTEIVSKHNDFSSNLNTAADVAAANDDIDNVKLPLGCENSIGDLDQGS